MNYSKEYTPKHSEKNKKYTINNTNTLTIVTLVKSIFITLPHFFFFHFFYSPYIQARKPRILHSIIPYLGPCSRPNHFFGFLTLISGGSKWDPQNSIIISSPINLIPSKNETREKPSVAPHNAMPINNIMNKKFP